MNTTLNVLHFLNSAHGGSALSTFQLIDALQEFNVGSTLVCFNNASPEQVRAISAKMEGRVLFIPLYWTNKRIRVKWWKRPLLELYSVFQTRKGYKYQSRIDALIRDNEIDVIHTSTLLNPEGAIAAARHRLPHVWHARELIGPGKYYQYNNYKRWAAAVDRQADFLIANSKVTLNNLTNYFSREKLKYIPNGIAVDQFSVRQHSDKNNFIVAMIGNVTSTLKNHKFFIEVAATFAAERTAEFRIYGALPEPDNPYYLGLQEMVSAYGPKDRLRFMGYRSDIANVIGEIDILFHPTRWESFGRIFIEAMAGGVPVIGLKNGGGEEMIVHGENGFLVDEDADKVSAMIRTLGASARLRNQLGTNGRNTVMVHYDLKLCAFRIFNLYQDVIASRRKSAL